MIDRDPVAIAFFVMQANPRGGIDIFVKSAIGECMYCGKPCPRDKDVLTWYDERDDSPHSVRVLFCSRPCYSAYAIPEHEYIFTVARDWALSQLMKRLKEANELCD